MSLFISFEGLDGSGKTSQVERLRERFAIEGIDAVFVREPGSTQIGSDIRTLLLTPRDQNEAMALETEILLFYAARAQLIHAVIKPALAAGSIVVADRFFDSSIAYQGYGRERLELVKGLQALLIDPTLVPDITFYLEASESVRERGLNKKGKDRMESESKDFFLKIQEGFEACIAENPDRFCRITTTQDDLFRNIHDIHEEIYTNIHRLILRKNHG